MKDPVFLGLVGLFSVVGAISGYYLASGLRDARIPIRQFYPRPKPIRSDGRESGYAYRDSTPGLYWTEIGMQVLAVGVSILMIFILMTAPDAPIR